MPIKLHLRVPPPQPGVIAEIHSTKYLKSQIGTFSRDAFQHFEILATQAVPQMQKYYFLRFFFNGLIMPKYMAIFNILFRPTTPPSHGNQ